MFEPTSRYHNLKVVRYTAPDGSHILYKQRRFLPNGDTLPVLFRTRVLPNDRLDLIAARTLGSPEQFWQICDANDAMNPFDLTAQPGRFLRVSNPHLEAG